MSKSPSHRTISTIHFYLLQSKQLLRVESQWAATIVDKWEFDVGEGVQGAGWGEMQCVQTDMPKLLNVYFA